MHIYPSRLILRRCLQPYKSHVEIFQTDLPNEEKVSMVVNEKSLWGILWN